MRSQEHRAMGGKWDPADGLRRGIWWPGRVATSGMPNPWGDGFYFPCDSSSGLVQVRRGVLESSEER